MKNERSKEVCIASLQRKVRSLTPERSQSKAHSSQSSEQLRVSEKCSASRFERMSRVSGNACDRPCKENIKRNRSRRGMSTLAFEVSWHSSFERVQVIGNWKNRQRKRVSDFTSIRIERVKILVNSYIRKVDRIGMRRSRKPWAARPREGWRYAVSKFRRAVSMNIAVEKRKIQHCVGDIKHQDSQLEEESWMIRRKVLDPVSWPPSPSSRVEIWNCQFRFLVKYRPSVFNVEEKGSYVE